MNSTLALKKSDYESEVGEYRGFGRGVLGGEDAWSTSSTTIIQLDVKSGLHRFYYCGHPWSFLKPFAQVILPQGETSTTLPDDFGGIDGGTKASLQNQSALFLRWLDFTGPSRVVQSIALTPSAVGIPRMLAIRPLKTMGPGKMQTHELIFFPKTDQDYTIIFPYFITPNYLLEPSQPFAYGGVEHHQTILEMCLAVAEQRRINQLGVHNQEALRLLELSKDIDRRQQPTNLGPNVDMSDNVGWWNRRYNEHGWSNLGGGVRINGVLYD